MEKSFLRCTNLSGRFKIQDIDLCKFISVKMNPNCIKTLKINGIYWIPGHDLRRLLSKLPAVEELYGLNTKLGFKSEDIVEYFKVLMNVKSRTTAAVARSRGKELTFKQILNNRPFWLWLLSSSQLRKSVYEFISNRN